MRGHVRRQRHRQENPDAKSIRVVCEIPNRLRIRPDQAFAVVADFFVDLLIRLLDFVRAHGIQRRHHLPENGMVKAQRNVLRLTVANPVVHHQVKDALAV